MLQPLRQKKMWFGQPQTPDFCRSENSTGMTKVAFVYHSHHDHVSRRSVSRGNKY